MEKRIRQMLEGRDPSQLLAILVAVIAVIVTLVLFTLWRRRRSAGQRVLITGLSFSGKTLLFSRLLHSKFVQTQTSVKENSGTLIVNNKPLSIVDIPGEGRLRYKFFDKYKATAKAMIFVIDSVTIQNDIRDVAEFLYTLLSDDAMQRNIPVLILCNKQDQAMSRGITVIKILLDNEMGLLKITKSNQLEDTDTSPNNSYSGKSGKDFDFSNLNCKVELAESSLIVKDNPDNPAYLDKVQAWLQKV